ncbi:uncharacterized protein LOC112083941 [Eutrema salsugineum]|uniref:uncharacterized protein LOC112083941 n=1 Tax=Eutrema salsugineum TaxID=72664 RepID=UPI000CED2270|nr:uncharacterized protein LOC112083941 [Eutrema salsugineum]
MASSSYNALDDEFDDTFDEVFNQQFDETLNAVFNEQAARRQKKKRAYIERECEQGHNRLWNDYFSEDATYPSNLFRLRFRMNKDLFLRIVHRLSNEVPIRMMAYGCAADAVDEYLRLGASTALLCLDKFTEGIIQLFGDEYLRRPTPEDLQRLLDVGEIRGFPGMIGSIDCMHWK